MLVLDWQRPVISFGLLSNDIPDEFVTAYPRRRVAIVVSEEAVERWLMYPSKMRLRLKNTGGRDTAGRQEGDDLAA